MNMKKAAGVAALALAGYDALVRPRMLGWGASRGEQHMQPPGDEIASGVPAHYTRAVIIEAPPEAVWPWLAQIGDHRAGFYSYDWVERFIFPGTVHYIEGTHSATRIHPELQEVHIGDRIDTAATFGDGLTAWWAVRYDCRWLEAGDRAWTLRPSRNARSAAATERRQP